MKGDSESGALNSLEGIKLRVKREQSGIVENNLNECDLQELNV